MFILPQIFTHPNLGNSMISAFMHNKYLTHWLLCGWLLMLPSGVVADDLAAGPRALSEAFRQASRRAIPSVVTIIAYGQAGENAPDAAADEENSSEEDKLDKPLQATGLGSGVIISASGTVLTNNHVIRNAARIIVKLQDGSELPAAEIVGDEKSDIATLKVTTELPLVPATLGDSSLMEIGDWVLAIGSPFQLEATVSAGIISAKDRTLPTIPRAALLQTDAVINPGNSGGPLVNIDGEVIGISTAIATRNGVFQGIGFAVPIDQANWIANELLDHGRVRRSRLGVQLAALKRQFADALKMEIDQGVVVYQVSKDSSGDKAGLRQMDVIIEFGGRRVRQPVELRRAIERLPIDVPQAVKIIRDGEELELEVTLEAADK
ncbi:S1C family serine protease [Planctomycetaceae bacterium SH139]